MVAGMKDGCWDEGWLLGWRMVAGMKDGCWDEGWLLG